MPPRQKPTPPPPAYDPNEMVDPSELVEASELGATAGVESPGHGTLAPAVAAPPLPPAEAGTWRRIDQAIENMIDGTTIPSDLDVLSAAGYDKNRLQSEIDRMTAIRDLRSRAGTRSLLAARTAAFAKFQGTAAAEREQLQNELAEVQSRVNRRLAELGSQERTDAAAIKRMTEAQEGLERFVPRICREAHQLEFHALFRSASYQDFLKLQVQVGTLENLIGLEARQRAAGNNHLEIVVSLKPDSPGYCGPFHTSGTRHEVSAGVSQACAEAAMRWPAKVAQLQARLAELKPKYDTLKQQFDERKAAISRKHLQVYVPE
jgi:hypothetical protein